MSIFLPSCNVSAFSLKTIFEYEKADHSNSLLNPDNILERPTDRAENVTLMNGVYDLLNGELGELVADFRFDYKYLKGHSSYKETEISGVFNELFYHNEVGNFAVSLGREKVRWGVGYSFSPTDIITLLRDPEDPDDRLQTREGTDLFRLSYTTGTSQSDIVYFPDVTFDLDNIKHSARLIKHRAGFRYYRYMDPVDVSLVGKLEEGGDWAAGANSSITIGKGLELHGEYLFTSSINKLYPSGEPEQFFLPFSKKGSGVHELLLGANYTFENYWNFILEYIYQSQGYSSHESDVYFDNVRFLDRNLGQNIQLSTLAKLGIINAASAVDQPLRQHYLFTRLFKENIFEIFSFEWYSFINLNDGSGFQLFQPKYSGSDLYDIYLRIENTWGKPESEFGLTTEDISAIIGITLFLGN